MSPGDTRTANPTEPATPPPAAAPAAADDAALMRAIARGESDALATLYDRHSPQLFAFCLRSLRDRAEAEDLILDIFWELWRRRDRYDAARSAPLTYLMNVTRSRIVDRLRSLRSSGAAPAMRDTAEEWPATGSAADNPVERLADAEAAARVRAAMGSLSPEQRQAIEMAYFEAMSYSQVAESLGQPLGTVKSRIRQALARLREVLGPPRAAP